MSLVMSIFYIDYDKFYYGIDRRHPSLSKSTYDDILDDFRSN